MTYTIHGLDADVVFVHVHNAGPGCFAAKVTR